MDTVTCSPVVATAALQDVVLTNTSDKSRNTGKALCINRDFKCKTTFPTGLFPTDYQITMHFVNYNRETSGLFAMDYQNLTKVIQIL